MKINLGCYDKKLPGFTNIDIRPEADPDIIDDAFELKTIQNNSVELIYSSHMLEHLNYDETKSALKLWYSKLIDGGILRLAVPDFESVCRRYIYNGSIEDVLHSVCGSQKHEFDYHYNIFDLFLQRIYHKKHLMYKIEQQLSSYYKLPVNLSHHPFDTE